VLKPARYVNAPAQAAQGAEARKRATKAMVGVDLFLDWTGAGGDALARLVGPLGGDGLELKAISNRGTKVWPGGSPETFCTDHWCCRFLAPDGHSAVSHNQVAALLARCAAAGLDFIKTEGLFTFDGERGYSAGGE
jgi:isocitrate dehydrogenase